MQNNKMGRKYGETDTFSIIKKIAEYLNEETELYNMMNKALDYLINGSNFTTGWIFYQ